MRKKSMKVQMLEAYAAYATSCVKSRSFLYHKEHLIVEEGTGHGPVYSFPRTKLGTNLLKVLRICQRSPHLVPLWLSVKCDDRTPLEEFVMEKFLELNS